MASTLKTPIVAVPRLAARHSRAEALRVGLGHRRRKRELPVVEASELDRELDVLQGGTAREDRYPLEPSIFRRHVEGSAQGQLAALPGADEVRRACLAEGNRAGSLFRRRVTIQSERKPFDAAGGAGKEQR